MVTQFEKRGIALVLAVMMCLSIVFSGTMSVYAADETLDENTEISDETVIENNETDSSNGNLLQGGSDNSSSDEVKLQETIAITKSKTKMASQTESVPAADIVISGNYKYSDLEDGTVEITGYTGSETDVTIPEQLDGKNVSIIGKEVFYKNKTIAKVSIPKTVTRLQYLSFSECDNLETVTLPSDSQLKTIDRMAFWRSGITDLDCPSVQEVGESAFSRCKNLSTVTFGDGLVSLGKRAFAYSGIQEFEIPKGLTKLEDGLFQECEKLTEITVPENIKSIGGYVFDSSGLKKIKIPDSVTYIGWAAFAYTGIREFTIPKSLTELEGYLFRGCKDLTEITVPENIKRIGLGAFAYTGLQKFTIPKSLTTLESELFKGCKALTEITVPENIKSIGNSAFASSGLKKIKIPDSVTDMAAYAFWNCADLGEVEIGNGLAYIAEYAFSNTGLENVIIGDSVKRIKRDAFSKNQKLTKIVLPKNVTELEYYAFSNCKNLENITFPDSLEKIEDTTALENTAWDEAQKDGVVYAGKVLYRFKGEMAPDTVVTVKKGTKGIAGTAFYGYENLKKITIPEGVTNIGRAAFYGCKAMESVVIPASVTEIGVKALGYIGKIGKTDFGDFDISDSSKIPEFTIQGVKGTAAETYAKENGFQFKEMAPLSLTIVPEFTDTKYVIGSENGAVIKCDGALEYFVSALMDGAKVDKSNYTLEKGSTILAFKPEYLDTLPTGKHTVTLEYIYGTVDATLETVPADQSGTGTDGDGTIGNTSGNYKYSDLEDGTVEITGYTGSETDVTIPEQLDGKNVSIIGKEVFYKNKTIAKVSIPKTVTRLQYLSFSECDNLKTVTLPSDSLLKTIDRMAFWWSGIKKLDCPSVQEVGESAFFGCKNLSTVTFGDGLISLGEGAFAYSGIQEFTIPKGLTKLGDGLFAVCENLKEITVPENIKSIGRSAFASSGLTKIEIPDSVTDIGRCAFEGCRNLSEAEIGNSMAYIAESVFERTGLEKVIIGDKVKRIGQYAFSENQKLKEIALPKNVTELEYAAFSSCENLENISFPDALEKIEGRALMDTAWDKTQKDGVVYAGKVLYRFKGEMKPNKVVSVKNGTKGIAAFAFDGYENLKEVTIPNGVSNIGRFAFYGCKNMTSVTVPTSVTEIGKMALGYMEAQNPKDGTFFSDIIYEYGIREDNNSVFGYSSKIPGFTIQGVKGTVAETYAKENGFQFKEMAAPPLKIVLELTNTQFVIGSEIGIVIKCEGELKYFISVYMDGIKVDRNNYTLERGSTILTFEPEYLNTLPSGKHTVTMEYTYGKVDVPVETATADQIRTDQLGTTGDGTTGNGATGMTGDGTTGNGATGTTDGGAASNVSNNTVSNNTASKNAIAPKTGDQEVIMLWVLAVIFAAGICIVLMKKRSEDL